MLDAYIIERIRQRQNRPRETQIPLRIEVPEPEQRAPRREEKKEDERGIVIIDFTI